MLCCLFNPKHDARNFLPLYKTRKVDAQQMHRYKPQKNGYKIRMTHSPYIYNVVKTATVFGSIMYYLH